MPYYIYRVRQIGPVRQLEKLAEHTVFKEASAAAKHLRQEAGDVAHVRIQVIFGENELQAEEALSEVRPAGLVTGED